VIANVGIAHAPVLAALHAEAFARPWAEQEFARLLALEPAFALIEQDQDSNPRGFLLAWAPGPDAEILTLAVAPHARRAGAATALVRAAFDHIGAAHAIILDVAEDNLAARALYARLGFVEIARRPAYYPGASGFIDALVLRKAAPFALA